MKKYLMQLARKDRWFTDNSEYAARSLWQWSEVKPGVYGTSILGVINGVLPLLGIVLVAVFDSDTKEPLGFTIKKKWW